jgi:hypothetical protein
MPVHLLRSPRRPPGALLAASRNMQKFPRVISTFPTFALNPKNGVA